MEETTTEETAASVSEKQLRTIKRLSKLAALLSLAVFLVLFVYSVRKLKQIDADIADRTEKLKTKTEEFNSLQGRVDGLRNETAELEEKIKKQKGQIQFQGEIIRQSPDVKESVKRAEEVNPQPSNVLPIIYLHIADESQRPRARELANKLQEKGYIVPDIENVGRKPSVAIPDATVLRSFRDRREEDINDIVNFLKSENVDVRNTERTNLRTRPRQYEIFFPKSFG